MTEKTSRDLPELLTIAEVSAASRLARKTWRNRAYRGVPPLPIKVGNRLRWRRSEILAFLGAAPDDEGAG